MTGGDFHTTLGEARNASLRGGIPGCTKDVVARQDKKVRTICELSMRNIYPSLLLAIAGSNQKELASQVRYLRIENQIVGSKLPKRISVTPQERNRWMRFAKKKY